MAILRMEHLGIVVRDIDAAKAFFLELGMELEGQTAVEGDIVDRINGLEGVKADVVILVTPDGHGKVELARYREPAGPDGDFAVPANTPGLRHLLFAVDDLHDTFERLKPHGAELVGSIENYSDMYLLCYLRGPEGIIVELAEKLS